MLQSERDATRVRGAKWVATKNDETGGRLRIISNERDSPSHHRLP